MTWATTRDLLETAIGAVSGITGGAGKVLDYVPLVTRPDTFSSLFKGTSTIHAWMITREGASWRQTGTALRFVPAYEVLVEGYHATATTGVVTEATWQALVDAVGSALAGSIVIWPRQPEDGPIVIRAAPIGHSSLGEVFCHYCQIRFTVQDTATIE